MNSVAIVRGEAPFLASRAEALEVAAQEIFSFVEREPELASQASIEIPAFEARTIIRRGATRRIAAAVMRGHESVAREDLEDLSRLETLSSITMTRLESFGASMGEADRSINISRLSEVVGLAATALGIVKTIF
jgi:hypothetical protein